MREKVEIMKKAKAGLALTMVAALLLGMAGCGSPTDTSTDAGSGADSTAGSSTAASGASSGSTSDLNVMLETEVESLDPQIATDGTSFEVIADFTDGLMQMDASGKAVPAVAQTYDVSQDGKTYTFHLRKDVKWSNGDPVTAKDFVFGWQRAVDPANASEYAYMLSDIGQVKNAQDIIDKKSRQIHARGKGGRRLHAAGRAERAGQLLPFADVFPHLLPDQ